MMQSRKRTLYRLVLVLVGLMLTSLACNVPEAITNIDPTAVAELDPVLVAARARNQPYLNSHPVEYCPGETVTVEWYGGDQLDSCSTYPLSVCRFVSIFAGAAGYSELSDSNDLEGSVVLTHLADSDVHGATIFLDVKEGQAYAFPTGETVDTLQMNIQEARGDHAISQWYELSCDPASNTWQWSPHSTDTTIQSSCMGIVDVCAQYTATVSAPGGDPQSVGSRGSEECSEAGVSGYHPDDVEVEIGSTPGYEIVGQPCSSGDTLPEDLHPYYLMTYSMACMPLEELHGSAHERCSANWATTVREPILANDDPTPTADIHTICNLQATCGNAICDAGCEDAASCPADCAAPPDLCADHGGTAWAGTTCVCPGLVDEVTICADNTKFDHVTEASCNIADPAECQSAPPQPTAATACICTCKVWSQTAFPPTCTKWTDCNGNTCSP